MPNRSRCFLAVCCIISAALTGCSLVKGWSDNLHKAQVLLQYPHARTGTLSQTPDEHFYVISEVVRRDKTALIDDLDLLFMTNRPTRLTRWHDR